MTIEGGGAQFNGYDFGGYEWTVVDSHIEPVDATSLKRTSVTLKAHAAAAPDSTEWRAMLDALLR